MNVKFSVVATIDKIGDISAANVFWKRQYLSALRNIRLNSQHSFYTDR